MHKTKNCYKEREWRKVGKKWHTLKSGGCTTVNKTSQVIRRTSWSLEPSNKSSCVCPARAVTVVPKEVPEAHTQKHPEDYCSTYLRASPRFSYCHLGKALRNQDIIISSTDWYRSRHSQTLQWKNR